MQRVQGDCGGSQKTEGQGSPLNRQWPKLALVMITLFIVVAGCGPKGFIRGTVHLGDEVLSNQQLVISVSGRSFSVITSSAGGFDITGIGLGSHELRISYLDPKTAQLYTGVMQVQVGIQGAGEVNIVLGAEPRDFSEKLAAAQRQLASGQWAKARQYLDELASIELEPQEVLALDMTWGWLYLQSGEGGEDHKQAMEHFQAALQGGGGAEAQVGLAGAAASIGQYEEACSHLEQALEKESTLELVYPKLNDGDLRVVLATWYMQTGDASQGLEILRHRTHGASAAGQTIKNALLAAFGG
ncbi:MAG: hypothetical protein GX986_04370 [Firmicutes bacterium]|nr:hypothetical protein [Bacillota bacterium]